MNFKFRLSCVLVAVLMTALVACGDSDDTAKQAAAVPADTSAPSAVPEREAADTPAAASARKNPEVRGALPANFPDDVSVYEDAEIAWSRASNDMAVSVRMYSDDDIEEVASFYSDDLAGNGWATEIQETPQGTLIIADKLSRKAAATVTESADGRTQIDLLVTELPR